MLGLDVAEAKKHATYYGVVYKSARNKTIQWQKNKHKQVIQVYFPNIITKSEIICHFTFWGTFYCFFILAF